ncbi:hypothetical protein BDM02DRAFT_3185536 [Thelephora ganbajun]|uniref:Uncharacterized protein n=1 Tax=Thelephora ganbajun TaxID=370292 RepID=A0ACB6ZKI9_THEGA|nr:hypothetical protein BDM02DRAFT_3185536 [Thelephora ganbajun]
MVASYPNIGDLFTVAYVSYCWRTTLLAFPNLLSNIQNGSVKKMLALLEWSKLAPLRISLQFARPPEEVMDSFYNNSAQIILLRSDNHTVLTRLLAHPMTSPAAPSIELDGLEVVNDAQDLPDEPADLAPSLRVLTVWCNTWGFKFCVPISRASNSTARGTPRRQAAKCSFSAMPNIGGSGCQMGRRTL